MSGSPDPPRKFYGFKPREFETANEPRPGDAPALAPARDPGIVPAQDGRIDVRDLARAATGGHPQLGANGIANRANDVHVILRANLARANAAGLNDLAPLPPRKSKRKRDYLLLLLGGNAVFALACVLQPILGFAGLVLFNVGLAWVMWGVMDDY